MTSELLRLGPFRAFWDAHEPKTARKRLAIALALSCVAHALLLLLTFGASGFGLPGFARPGAERSPPPLPLDVKLVEAPPPKPTPTTPTVTLRTSPQLSAPRREARVTAPAAKRRAREQKLKPLPQKPILAQREPVEKTFPVPPPRVADPEPQHAPQVAARSQAEEPPAAPAAEDAERRKAEEAARLAEQKARQEAEELARQRALAQQQEAEAKKLAEAKRIEEAKQEEEARRLAEVQEQEALKKAEEARKLAEVQQQEELKKKEEAQRLALELDALRRAEELARQAAARQKELEAKRQAEAEAKRQADAEAKRVAEEAAKRAQETAAREKADAEAAAQRERLAAQKPSGPAPGAPSGRELAAKALEQLRTPGKARDELLRPPGPPPPVENLRRRALVGSERDVLLRSYVDSWRWKTERNGSLNYRRSASWRVYEPPIVTVSIRSDGSLEHVSIHRSSGIREIDEAVRRIAHLHAPYSAFPPAMARQYDVVDIRRVWFFEDKLVIRDE